MFKLATAKHGLAWTPSEFWNAAPYELWLALEELEQYNARIAEARENK